jgi:hypothetical protein
MVLSFRFYVLDHGTKKVGEDLVEMDPPPSGRTVGGQALGGWKKLSEEILLRKLRKLSRFMTGVIVILLFAALNASATSEVTCVTDKIGYYQGEQVLITITNNSSKDIEIPDIEYIDGRFARPAREIKLKIGRAWKAMIIVGTVDDIKTKVLKTNESHGYKLKLQTIDESMNETTSIPGLYVRPGTYIVFFHNEYKLFPFEIGSNEFTIKDIISTPNSSP